MTWRQKESAIREKRTIEATKKNLMGPSGKLGTICQYLGKPIIRQGNIYTDVGLLSDVYEDSTDSEYETTLSEQQGPLVYRDEIQEYNEDFVQREGFVFDGLNNGLHLEIQFWIDSSKITTFYKGYLVYKEIAGELEAYAPFPDWENIVEKLYKTAKNKMKEVKEIETAQTEKNLKEMKKTFWQRLRLRWGI